MFEKNGFVKKISRYLKILFNFLFSSSIKIFIFSFFYFSTTPLQTTIHLYKHGTNEKSCWKTRQ